jgi:hypothetical protein
MVWVYTTWVVASVMDIPILEEFAIKQCVHGPVSEMFDTIDTHQSVSI